MERPYVFERNRAFITPFAQYAHQVNEAAYAAGEFSYVKYDEKRNAIKAFEHYTTFFAGRRNLMLSEIEPYLIEGYVKYRREVLENTNEEVIVRSLRPVIAAVKAAALYDQFAASTQPATTHIFSAKSPACASASSIFITLSFEKPFWGLRSEGG